MVSSLNGFTIRPNRPRALGRPRFRVMFLPTQLVHVQIVIVFRVRDGGLKAFLHVLRDPLLGEGEIGESRLDLLSADHRGHQVQFLRAGAKHAQFRHCFVVGHAARVLVLAHGCYLRFAFLSAACP